MRRAIYPGSFDPVTNGHLDVIERARKLFDEVIVAVAHNDEKQPLFSLDERLDLLRQTVGEIDNVRIAEFKGLLVEFAKEEKARSVVLREGATVEELVRALAAIGSTPRDVIAILQSLRSAGALEAELEVI